MPDAIYTLNELADLVDIRPRTIRSYIQQDLLRGPDSMGRNARYSDYHRKRLEAIKALRDDYALPLDEIRRLVNLSDFDEDITLAALPLPPAVLPLLAGSTPGPDVYRRVLRPAAYRWWGSTLLG